MTAPRMVSDCCGAEVRREHRKDGHFRLGEWVVDAESNITRCSACGQPCTPMPADVRERIASERADQYRAEGMRQAADYISGGKKPTDESLREFRGADLISRRVCAAAIRRAADALEGKK